MDFLPAQRRAQSMSNLSSGERNCPALRFLSKDKLLKNEVLSN